MNCYKCGKEMGRDDKGPKIIGMSLDADPGKNPTKETIAYFNKQLGKYSNGKGVCPRMDICFECLVDAILR